MPPFQLFPCGYSPRFKRDTQPAGGASRRQRLPLNGLSRASGRPVDADSSGEGSGLGAGSEAWRTP